MECFSDVLVALIVLIALTALIVLTVFDVLIVSDVLIASAVGGIVAVVAAGDAAEVVKSRFRIKNLVTYEEKIPINKKGIIPQSLRYDAFSMEGYI